MKDIEPTAIKTEKNRLCSLVYSQETVPLEPA